MSVFEGYDIKWWTTIPISDSLSTREI